MQIYPEHFHSTTALSFGSVCTSQLSLAAHIYRMLCLQLEILSMFDLLPAVRLILSWITLSLQSNCTSVHSKLDWDCLSQILSDRLFWTCSVLGWPYDHTEVGNVSGLDSNILNTACVESSSESGSSPEHLFKKQQHWSGACFDKL